MFARLIFTAIGVCAMTVPNAVTAQGIPKCKGSPYASVSLAPIFIQIQPKDTATGNTMLLANSVFVSFMAERKGTKKENFPAFVDDFYVPFMEEHEGKPIDFDIDDFMRWAIERNFEFLLVSKEERYTLADLGFDDRAALLHALVRVEKRKVRVNAGPTEYVGLFDRRFIALLLDQDISIGYGEIVLMPFLCDRRR